METLRERKREANKKLSELEEGYSTDLEFILLHSKASSFYGTATAYEEDGSVPNRYARSMYEASAFYGESALKVMDMDKGTDDLTGNLLDG